MYFISNAVLCGNADCTSHTFQIQRFEREIPSAEYKLIQSNFKKTWNIAAFMVKGLISEYVSVLFQWWIQGFPDREGNPEYN